MTSPLKRRPSVLSITLPDMESAQSFENFNFASWDVDGVHVNLDLIPGYWYIYVASVQAERVDE